MTSTRNSSVLVVVVDTVTFVLILYVRPGAAAEVIVNTPLATLALPPLSVSFQPVLLLKLSINPAKAGKQASAKNAPIERVISRDMYGWD